MRPRVLTCDPGTLLVTVAQRMASEHVHAIVVLLETVDPEADRTPSLGGGHRPRRPAQRGLHRRPDRGRGRDGRGPPRPPDERLPDVAQRMLEHGTSHAVVVEPRTGRPVGVLSTLDIAGILGWGLG